MIRSLLVVILSFFGTAVFGESALIRSGDHPNFSRLVIDIPVGAKWEVGRIADGYAVQIESVTEFETSNIFTRISTSRIIKAASLSDPVQLALNSNCECHATAFLWKADKLVVDINDGPAPDNSRFEANLQSEIEPSILPIITQQVSLPLKANSVPSLGFVPSPADKPQLGDLEQIIIEGLARAATQGLLEPALNAEPSTNALIHVDNHFIGNEPGLLAHTSIDIDVASVVSAEDVPEACLPDDYFDIASWVNDLQFDDRLAQARAAVAHEFDEADPDAVVELARVYLIFGFGREAQNALNIDGRKSQERKMLSLMGAIIDGDPTEETALNSQLMCDGPVALWAFLAQTHPLEIEVGRNNILRVFRSLPRHLQAHLGPTLSEKFRIIGDFEAAEIVLLRDESDAIITFEAAIAETDLLTDLGKSDEATQLLADLAATDSRMTPSALIDYLTLTVDAGESIDHEAIALGDILRFENQGSDIVGDIAAAQILALIAIEDLNRAFQLLADEAEAIGNERKDYLTSETVRSASEVFNDTDFMELGFETPLESISPDVQNLVALRLLSLGLPERAAQYVDGPAIGSAMMERRYLRAQADLGVDNSEAAIAELAGLSTERAERLRSQANLIAIGREEISTVAFGDDWKLGNWAALAQSDDTLLQDVSRTVLTDVESIAGTKQPLADGRRLLAESSEMRNLLDEMLTRFETVSE